MLKHFVPEPEHDALGDVDHQAVGDVNGDDADEENASHDRETDDHRCEIDMRFPDVRFYEVVNQNGNKVGSQDVCE